MSDVTSILTSRVDIKRFSASIIDNQVVVSSVNASRQPGRSSRIEINLQGCVYNGGVVTINGNVSETLSFSADGTQVGKLDFTTFAGLSFSGITGGYVKARAVTNMGQPINQLMLVVQSLPVRFFQNTGFQKGFEAGQQLIGSKRVRIGMMMEPSPIIDIYQNDYVYGNYGIVGLTLMHVDFFEAIYDFAGATHHLEAWLTAI